MMIHRRALSLLLALAPLAAAQDNPQHVPLNVGLPNVETLRVNLRGQGGYGERDNCPQVATYTDASFSGGTYTAQGGFAEGEIAAVSYTLPAVYFPLKFQMAEFIVAQQNAIMTTTTEWSLLVWNGTPDQNQLVAEFNSDGSILPHIIMGPGTRGTNVQASVDSQDPDQIFILNENNNPTHTFTVGLRIDRHNQQTANPCFTAPPSDRNAFPTTDNTIIGCGTGYGQLNYPTQNWLFAVNCGPNGCPPNGGWTRFSNLQTDQTIVGICFTGCRPRGDWVMRVTFDPVNCPPPDGACCFGTAGCIITSQAACQGAGGNWRGPGSTCGIPQGGVFPGCVAPANTPPVADAGFDQTLDDTDNNGTENFTVTGAGSFDGDAGDFIANYRWNEGETILQDGPALFAGSLPVGVHTLTLTVTDSRGGTDTDEVVITINPGAGGCDADVNCDGVPDQGDVACMILAVAGDMGCFCQADPDFNHDGVPDQGDVADIILVVAGAPCP